MTQQQPTSKINSATHSEKLTDKGLNSETVTKEQVAEGLKMLMGYHNKDRIGTLRLKPEVRGLIPITIALAKDHNEFEEDLEDLVAKFDPKFKRGQTTVEEKLKKYKTPSSEEDKKKKPYGITIGVGSLELNIKPDKENEFLKALAVFVNTEAAKDPEILKRVSTIQQNVVDVKNADIKSVGEALKIAFGFDRNDILTSLQLGYAGRQADEPAQPISVTIALPQNDEDNAVQNRIKNALNKEFGEVPTELVKTQVHTGSAFKSFKIDALKFSIAPKQEKQLLQVMAKVVNKEVAKNPELLERFEAIKKQAALNG